MVILLFPMIFDDLRGFKKTDFYLYLFIMNVKTIKIFFMSKSNGAC